MTTTEMFPKAAAAKTPPPESPAPNPAGTPRQKRSWGKVQLRCGEDVVTFWPTPEGLHRRKKGSPKVKCEPWDKINDFMRGDVFSFEFDNRKYEVWRGVEGFHIRRGTEEYVVKWAQFIEFLDGQKLLGI